MYTVLVYMGLYSKYFYDSFNSFTLAVLVRFDYYQTLQVTIKVTIT